MIIKQPILEKAMYLLLVLLFITNFVVAFVLYNEYREVKNIISNQARLTIEVKANQTTNALAIKTYIACLLAIPPGTASVTNAEHTCFDDAPPVK
jgi:hypothetical protein